MTLKPFVNISGQGSAIALLHGWGLHGGIWETLVPKLAENYTVHNIDLPGFGYSPVYNGDYNLDYLVDSVADVLPEECVLLGWSLGGLVATKLAINYPEKIKKLITVSSNPSFVANDNWQGMKLDVLESFIGYLEEDYEGTLIRFLGIQTMGSKTQKDDLKMLKDTVFIHGQPSKKALRGGLQILKDNDLTEQLKQIKIPMLRLYGRLDALVPNKVCAAVDSLHQLSESKVYRKSAHAPFLSQFDEFYADLSQFIATGSINKEHN